jgi:hypothetical protein
MVELVKNNKGIGEELAFRYVYSPFFLDITCKNFPMSLHSPNTEARFDYSIIFGE